jgi:hypothetical protein
VRILGERQPHHVHAENSADQSRRQEDRSDDGKHMKVAIGLLGRLDGDFLLKQMRPVAQRDNLDVEPIEALPQFCRRQPERKRLTEIELEALNERKITSCRWRRTVVRLMRPSTFLPSLMSSARILSSIWSSLPATSSA